MGIADKPPPNRAFLPDAERYNPDAGYLTHLQTKTTLSTRALEKLLGFAERSWRNFLTGKSRLPYTAQYCLEVLARSGIDEPPRETGVWFSTRQRPLRDSDAGRLIVARVGATLRFGRVSLDGYGVGIDAVPGTTVDGGRIGANVVSDYLLADYPPS